MQVGSEDRLPANDGKSNSVHDPACTATKHTSDRALYEWLNTPWRLWHYTNKDIYLYLDICVIILK